MSERLQAVRGMSDILPDATYRWRFLEQTIARIMLTYGYAEIRMPILENTALFKRSIGEVTDIVEKEMYTFLDRNGDSLTLRPEGTASCVRACLEHGLLHNQQQKLWYMGSMFRHERPQKGRYRQFTQCGAEVFGISGVAIELELLALNQRIWQALGLEKEIKLQINTLGTIDERATYRKRLVEYFRDHWQLLDDESRARLEKNPLRLLDSKSPDLQLLIQKAPQLIETLHEDSNLHFSGLCQGLEALGIAYEINPCLVRGLDYYEHTVFEWVTENLGAQATVCAGGRYDGLVAQLGGKPTPAVGFGMGIERILLLMEAHSTITLPLDLPHVYVIAEGNEALRHALVLVEQVRNQASQLSIILNTADGSIKNQFKKADKSGAQLALIIGEDELRDGVVTVKDLRGCHPQVSVSSVEVSQVILGYLGENVCQST